MESDYLYTVYEINPSDNNGIITLRANISSTDILYLQVIALVEEGDDYEYISYKGYEYHKPIPQPEEEEKEEEKENKKEEKENKEEEKENKEEEKGNQEEEKENKEEEKENKEEEKEEEKEGKNGDRKNDEQNNNESKYIITICVLSGIIAILLILIIIHFVRKKTNSNEIEFKNIGFIEPKQMS